MTAQELKEAGEKLFNAHRYAEAVPLLKSAAEAFPTDEHLWQELVFAANGDQAIDFAKQAIRQHPRSGWLWRHLGYQLTTADRLDEAENALNNARSLLNQNDGWIWRYLAALHRKRKNLEKEIEALEHLHALGEANATDLNILGVGYFKNRDLAKALEFCRLSADAESDTAYRPLLGMGMLFSDPEVSQDADAADAYRRALALKPDYEPAKERLDTTKRKLAPLAEQARTQATGLVQSDDLFHFFVSPFEALQIEADEELDVKVIQRAKKRLLQEIDLNDGKVRWLDDYPLDKSRAIAMEDELHDDVKRRYQSAIFHNTRLLRFLTRGEIEHFLYSDEYFPQDTLELLDEEPEFRAFLSKPFAREYNLVLSRAIDGRLLAVVEALFDGRRWVDPADDDICFEGAYKRIGDLVELMRSKARDARVRKVSLSDMEEFLREHSYPEIFNLLPTAFASLQTEVVTEIRSLAVSCFNEHDDPDLSKGVLNLCNLFTLRNHELSTRLKEDFKTIEEIISKQRDMIIRRVVDTRSQLAWPGLSLARPEQSEPLVAEQQRNKESYNKSNLWWLVIPAIVIILLVLIRSADSTKTAPSTGSSEPKTPYRIPSNMNAELERDSQVIDREKAKAERMATELGSLRLEIERDRLTVDRTSQLAIDASNRKVDTYNRLLEEARAQERLVNQLVENYNDKIRKLHQ
jgi:tetratricopeptide (TPR) repeat protein